MTSNEEVEYLYQHLTDFADLQAKKHELLLHLSHGEATPEKLGDFKAVLEKNLKLYLHLYKGVQIAAQKAKVLEKLVHDGHVPEHLVRHTDIVFRALESILNKLDKPLSVTDRTLLRIDKKMLKLAQNGDFKGLRNELHIEQDMLRQLDPEISAAIPSAIDIAKYMKNPVGNQLQRQMHRQSNRVGALVMAVVALMSIPLASIQATAQAQPARQMMYQKQAIPDDIKQSAYQAAANAQRTGAQLKHGEHTIGVAGVAANASMQYKRMASVYAQKNYRGPPQFQVLTFTMNSLYVAVCLPGTLLAQK